MSYLLDADIGVGQMSDRLQPEMLSYEYMSILHTARCLKSQTEEADISRGRISRKE
jgi:hypothetical protein